MVRITKVLGMRGPPPYVGKNSQIIPYFFPEAFPYIVFRRMLHRGAIRGIVLEKMDGMEISDLGFARAPTVLIILTTLKGNHVLI